MLNVELGNNTVNGIFASLKCIDGVYFSRYSIHTTLTHGNITNIVSYPEYGDSMQCTTSEAPYVTVTFKTPMIVSGYMMVNAYYIIPRSYPTAWKVTGKYLDNPEVELDSQTNFKFCEGCDKGYVPKYRSR